MKIGDRVKTTQTIREDDWFECAWDEDHEPYQIEEGTEGIVTSVDRPYAGFCSVTFGAIEDVLVCYESDVGFYIEVVSCT